MLTADQRHLERIATLEARIGAFHAELAAIEDDIDGWTDDMAGGMRTAVTRLRRQLNHPRGPADGDAHRSNAARLRAALDSLAEFADTLEEMVENAARPDDRRIYQAIAADIHKRTQPALEEA